MAATDLLARNPRPSRDAIEDGLGGVLCRCTGYQKIVEAVLEAAGVGAPVPVRTVGAAGTRARKVDGWAKITGAERFGADSIPADALHVRVIRSPHARASFKIGDLAPFLAGRPGIVRVLTAADVPRNGHGIYPNIKDQPVLAETHVRYRGEAILAFVGTREAVQSFDDDDVPIDFVPLSPVLGIDAAKATELAPASRRPSRQYIGRRRRQMR